MGEYWIVIRVIHMLSAALWMGTVFFLAWFALPAIRKTGADGGKVMAAIEKGGWAAFVPSIAGVTILSGVWLYRPYMGAAGSAAALYGYGGVIGIIALAIGGSVVGRSVKNAAKLAVKAAAMPEGSERGALMNSAAQLRQRALTFARIVSLLIILTAVLMTIAAHT